MTNGGRRWLRAVPRRRGAWVVAVVVVAWYAIAYVATVLLVAVVFHDPLDWGRPAGGFIGTALGTGLVTWWRSRRMGGADQVARYERAVKTGRLPDDADPAVWRPLLVRELQVQRRARAWMFACFAVLGIALLTLLGVEGIVPAWSIAPGVLAVVVVVATLDLLGRRDRAKIQRLLDQLPEGDMGAAAR